MFLGIILLIARRKIEEKTFSLFMCSQKQSPFLYVRIFYIGFPVIRENIRTPFKKEWLFSNWTRFEFLRVVRNISSLNEMQNYKECKKKRQKVTFTIFFAILNNCDLFKILLHVSKSTDPLTSQKNSSRSV